MKFMKERLDIVFSLILGRLRRPPRLLPLYSLNEFYGISAKETAQMPCPAFLDFIV